MCLLFLVGTVQSFPQTLKGISAPNADSLAYSLEFLLASEGSFSLSFLSQFNFGHCNP